MDDKKNVAADPKAEAAPVGGRRRLLDSAGRIALATPPAITLLLASGGSQPAWASGVRGGGGGSSLLGNPGNGKSVGKAGENPGGNTMGSTGARGKNH